MQHEGEGKTEKVGNMSVAQRLPEPKLGKWKQAARVVAEKQQVLAKIKGQH